MGAERGAANHAVGLLLQEADESMVVHKSSMMTW